MARVLRKLLRHQPDATDREGHIRAILELSFPQITDELRDLVRALSEGVLPDDAIERTLAGTAVFSDPQEWSDDERAEVEAAVIAAAALYATSQPLSMPELRDRLLPCNRPGASLDMATWREMPFWTAAEAAALSLGKDPHLLDEGSLVADEALPTIKRFKEQRERIRRAMAIGLVGHDDMVIPQKLGLAGGCRVLGGFEGATTPAGLEKWGADTEGATPGERQKANRSRIARTASSYSG